MNTYRLGAAAFLLLWSALAGAQVQEAPAPRFAIQGFQVEGNTLIPAPEVDALLAPYRGPGRDFGTVQLALEALQQAYVERGYSAVRVLVPEQDLVSGRVRLQVIEARLRGIRVENNRHFSEANVRAGMASLRPGEPPNTRRIAENVQQVNENPAKQVTVVLEGTDEPGKADALLRVVDEEPSRASISLDNTGNSQTGEFRLGLGYQHANVADRDHVFTAQFITSPSNMEDVVVFGAGYRIPIYSWGGTLDFVAGYSDVNSGTVQDLFNVSGSGTILGARYTQVLRRIGAYEQKLALGLDYRAFRQNVSLIGIGGTLVPDITVRPVSLTYSGRLARVGSDFSVIASVSQNLPGGRDGDQAAFTAQRLGAPEDYTIWRLAAAWSLNLPRDFILRAVADSQYTNDPLVPGEQFGLGGASSVRGFYEREAANDRGLRLTGELYGPEIGDAFGPGWRGRLLAFIDSARGADAQPVRGGENGLSSVGLGIRLSHGRSLSFRGDVAYVTNPSLGRPNNTGRVHFALAYRF